MAAHRRPLATTAPRRQGRRAILRRGRAILRRKAVTRRRRQLPVIRLPAEDTMAAARLRLAALEDIMALHLQVPLQALHRRLPLQVPLQEANR